MESLGVRCCPEASDIEDVVLEDLSLMFLARVSTRTLSLISRRLIGRFISHEEVSRADRELTEAIERWRTKDMSREPVKYLFLDGVNFKMHIGGSVEQVPVVVAIVLSHKKVLGLQSDHKESASS